MKTYIKIYGPPVLEAIQTLERVAVEVSKEFPDITYYDTLGGIALPYRDFSTIAADIADLEASAIEGFRRKLLSDSGWTLGDHDFYFEWAAKPTFDQLKVLISKVDEALKPLGCRYTITTK